MNDKELNKKFCEVVGVEPKVTIEFDYGESNVEKSFTSEEAKDDYILKNDLVAIEKHPLKYPDFINNANNFVRLGFIKISKTYNDTLFSSFGSLLKGDNPRGEFLNRIISYLEDTQSEIVKGAIKSEQWEM